MGWDRNRFVDQDKIVNDIICFICAKVAEDSKQAACEHIFCTECIDDWLEEGHDSCPVDKEHVSQGNLKQPHRLTLQLINNLTIHCKHFTKGCRLLTSLEHMPQLMEHEDTGCPFYRKVDLGTVRKEINGLRMKCSALNAEINLRAMAIEDKNGFLEEKEDKIEKLQKEFEETERSQKRVWKKFGEKVDQLSKMVQLNTIKDSETISVHRTVIPNTIQNERKPRRLGHVIANSSNNENECKLSHICVSDHSLGDAHEFASPKCLRGHTMMIDSARPFSCDICFSRKENQPRWRCDECDDDFCFSCYPI